MVNSTSNYCSLQGQHKISSGHNFFMLSQIRFHCTLSSKYSARSAYYLGMTFINRERIALLESKFHFQIEYCDVTTVAMFQIRNADWFIIDMRRMFTCK